MNNMNSDELVYIVKFAQSKIDEASRDLSDLVDSSDYTLLSANVDSLVEKFNMNLSIISKVSKAINSLANEADNNHIDNHKDYSDYSNLPCTECSIRSTLF